MDVVVTRKLFSSTLFLIISTISMCLWFRAKDCEDSFPIHLETSRSFQTCNVEVVPIALPESPTVEFSSGSGISLICVEVFININDS